jgi:hypothetical protein
VGGAAAGFGVATGTEVGVGGGGVVGVGGGGVVGDGCARVGAGVNVGGTPGVGARVASAAAGVAGSGRLRLTKNTSSAITMISAPSPSAIHGIRFDNVQHPLQGACLYFYSVHKDEVAV